MKLTQEQLAKLIAKVFSNLTAKFAEAGKNVNDITTDDILAELSAVLDEMNAADDGEGAPAGDGEGKGEGEGAPAGEGEGEGEGKGFDGDELIGKIMEALSGMLGSGDEGKAGCGARSGDGKSGGAAGEGKGAAGPSSTGAGAPKAAPQRKYASLFLSTGASRDGNGASGFKTRIASMSAPERRKAAYGMFGRAVKCIHASGGDIDRAAFTAERKFGDAEMAREFKALQDAAFLALVREVPDLRGIRDEGLHQIERHGLILDHRGKGGFQSGALVVELVDTLAQKLGWYIVVLVQLHELADLLVDFPEPLFDVCVLADWGGLGAAGSDLCGHLR